MYKVWTNFAKIKGGSLLCASFSPSFTSAVLIFCLGLNLDCASSYHRSALSWDFQSAWCNLVMLGLLGTSTRMLSWGADQFKHLEVQVALVNTHWKILQLRQELSVCFCLVDFLFTQLLFLQLKCWLALLSREVVCAKQMACPLPGTVHLFQACQLYIPLI